VPVQPLSLLLCVLVGASIYTVIAAFCHDAAHGSISKNKFVNSVFLYIGFALIGVNGHLWKYRHLQKHHPFPNVKGSDVDADSSAFIRLSPLNPWRPIYRYQPYFAPFLYGLVLQTVTWWEDFIFFEKYKKEKPEEFGTFQMLCSFYGCKIIHVIGFIVMPILIMPIGPWEWAIGYIIITSASSFLFVLVNVGSHITDVCEFAEPDSNNRIQSDWAEHQLASSVDWSPSNKFFVVLTGGANSHAAHHLFPYAAHCHNAALAKIVQKHTDNSGFRYNKLTFCKMLSAHWRLLKKLSLPPIEEGTLHISGGK
jgi:linoleoyl-CoA desaturase